MSKEYIEDFIKKCVNVDDDVYHPNGYRRVIYINGISSESVVYTLPKRRPLLIPFYKDGMRISIVYERGI